MKSGKWSTPEPRLVGGVHYDLQPDDGRVRRDSAPQDVLGILTDFGLAQPDPEVLCLTSGQQFTRIAPLAAQALGETFGRGVGRAGKDEGSDSSVRRVSRHRPVVYLRDWPRRARRALSAL